MIPSKNARLRPSCRRPIVLVLAAGLFVGGCGGDGAEAVPTPSATALRGVTPTPAPTEGPATMQITLTGDPAVAGSTSAGSIQCNYPTVGGPVIVLYPQLASGGATARIELSSELVSVRYAAGSGKTYVERDFTGTGVTSFDAATGAQVDAALDGVANAAATGTLGAILSIKGSVDCGNQQPGRSTITLTGATAQGQLSGTALDPVLVECDSGAQAASVQVAGVAMVGPITTLFVIVANDNGSFSVSQEPQTGLSAFYTGRSVKSVTLSAGGLHISADAIETLPAGSKETPHKITVSGDATCGTP